jgi:hypothetical protein
MGDVPQERETSASPAHPLASFDDLTAEVLDAAAAARREWEGVCNWRAYTSITDDSAAVTWQFASSVPGYRALSKEVSAIVGERLGLVIAEALDRIELRARRKLAEALAGAQRSELSPHSAAEMHLPQSQG